jgi:hypothetical protein
LLQVLLLRQERADFRLEGPTLRHSALPLFFLTRRID